MAAEHQLGLTIVIPTFQREEPLVNSLHLLLSLPEKADEVIVVDQTEVHVDETVARLAAWQQEGSIRWVRRETPSITAAMNQGLRLACNPLVLFLDDDIVPDDGLVTRHRQEHAREPGIWASVGRVVQPWQQAESLRPPSRLRGLRKDFDFPFHSTLDAPVENVMAGNLCVKRELALFIGGFDENFEGSAYRFETDFARRVLEVGGQIRYLGGAGINHLRLASGGTRSLGNHLTSTSPLHGMGDYYYAFKHGGRLEAWRYSIGRLGREVRTRFHLTHPWWIPPKLFGEMRALRLARRRLREGPRLLGRTDAA